ncbi:hypothetical protein P168DRAFT_330605 [Aspergillus campestris IBT 28561]|uniref:DUF4238 domain-containing protein n=1 Tax=Aspergillus campestris (strain IBT 28561) TaxID=1392248 RepID=A0A2I1CQX5_ASPC2|nr:uncharacterized protein P168DRAFT_330605 [Aspergillus campestris IBT 28561]PKY00030.1 hypothetical protein P168DRAFT_330605 [Aspergillus campestris IBT 28561]
MPVPRHHHFIPQFILRKFAADEQPPAGPSRRKTRRRRDRDFLVNKVDLTRGILTQRPVSREYALVDMYRDPGFEDNPNHLEEKLSRLENDASKILRHTLRKFLFLMKYRNSRMFQRYDHDRLEDYNEDDKHRMVIYMKHKKFSRPRDVWFSNLRGLLELDMDAGGQWRRTIFNHVYPDDAMMFVAHVQTFFLTFCEPESPQLEFLLTENSFGVYEGPSDCGFDARTGKIVPGLYTKWHMFAPVAPRLLIILRSNMLSAGDSESSADSARLGAYIRSLHQNPERAGSILDDLPVRRCANSYSAQGVPNATEWTACADHRFYFECFRLSCKHVELINTLFLEESHAVSSIVYHAQDALRASLKAYLLDRRPGFKTASDHPLDQRKLHILALEKIARDLGMTEKAKYTLQKSSPRETHMSAYVAGMVGIELMKNVTDDTRLPGGYRMLRPDATPLDFFEDLKQAGLLLLLRIKTDRILQFSPLSLSQKNCVRQNRQDFSIGMTPWRVWLYLKVSRNLPKYSPSDFRIQLAPLEVEGVEDGFVELLARYPERSEDLFN